MGLLGPGLESPRPCQIQGVRQMAGPHIPPACPHCHATDAMWATDTDSGHCGACGSTFFRTLYTYTPAPPKKYHRPVWLMNLPPKVAV
jgi:hypothetical protein